MKMNKMLYTGVISTLCALIVASIYIIVKANISLILVTLFLFLLICNFVSLALLIISSKNKQSRYNNIIPIVESYITNVDKHVGGEYFRAMTDGILAIAKPDLIIVGKYIDKDKSVIQSYYVRSSKGVKPNFVYDLTDTPCNKALSSFNPLVINDNVDQLYPRDKFLTESEFKGYLGFPLIGNKKEKLGIVVCLWQTPLEKNHNYANTLQVFITRASAELARVSLEKDLIHKAKHDHLTGLPNRLYLSEKIQQSIDEVKLNRNMKFDFLFIDIDNFKQANDKYGHRCGDVLLKKVAEKLKEVTTPNDFVARLGGDEFAIIRKNSMSVENLAKKIKNTFEERLSLSDNISINITVSIGSVNIPNDCQSEKLAYQYADFAMYAVKKSGRNGFKKFTKDDYNLYQKDEKLKDQLQHTVENDEISIAIQPLQSTDPLYKGPIVAEVLARWTNRGIAIEPDVFIALAEHDNTIDSLGKQIIEKSCELINKLDNNVILMINCSAKQFDDPYFVDFITNCMDKHKVSRKHLVLEITESLIANNDNLKKVHGKLEEYGIELAIDDFGTGTATLSYIVELPATIVKLDKSFIKNIATNHQVQTIVKSVSQVASAYNYTKIVEGVEDADTYNRVKDYYDFVQGHYISLPLTEEDFINYYERNKSNDVK